MLKYNYILFYFLFLGISSLSNAKPLEFGSIPVSRDPTNSPQPTRSEYLIKFPETPFEVFNIERYQGENLPHRDEEGRVLLTVNHRLLGAHSEQFQRFVDDLQNDGYEVTLLDVAGGSAEELKNLLIEQGGGEAVGVIFAGQLPLAWFEQLEYFDSDDEPDNQRLAEYPVDLFFMDWSGEWSDTSGNGIYDVHQGDWEPDVWLGRIAGYNLSRINEDSLVASYLDRDHAYRSGELTLPHKALCYIDDDWRLAATEWSSEMEMAYGQVDLEIDPEATSATGYTERIESGYEMVEVAVHSTTDTHSFFVNDHSQYDYFRFTGLRDNVRPRAMFYNLFACSAMNLDRNLCLGALYALKPPFGLGSVGSSKVGGMLFFEDYYGPLGDGATLGEALKGWLTLHAHEPGHENWARSWFYGMTHFGDPTLRLPQGLKVIEYEVLDDQGDGDGVADAGEHVSIRFFITNRNSSPFEDVIGSVTINDSLVSIDQSRLDIGTVNPGDIAEAEGVELTISEASPDRHTCKLMVEMTTGSGEVWWGRVSIPIRSARIVPVAFETKLANDVANGFVGPGESGDIVVTFRNEGGEALADSGFLHIESLSPWCIVTSDSLPISRIEPGRTQFSAPMHYAVEEGIDQEYCNLFRISASRHGVSKGSTIISVPMSANSQFTDSFDTLPAWIEHYPTLEGYSDVWQWDAFGGENSGGLCFGGPDTNSYPAHSDAVLELPLMVLGSDAELFIRHSIDVEAEYDACVVEVNFGEEWTRATPVGGYNGNSVDNGSYPGGPCWNGSFDWRDDRIPLNGPDGPVRIRLRFASDNGVEGRGWRIDRLQVRGTNLDVQNIQDIPQSYLMLDAYPNPFNSSIKIKYDAPAGATISLYDSNGKLVQPSYNVATGGVSTIGIDYSLAPAGIYFLQLETGQDRLIKNLVLVK